MEPLHYGDFASMKHTVGTQKTIVLSMFTIEVAYPLLFRPIVQSSSSIP